ncbi:MAG: hypothetical protein V4493_01085 [Pseudomonadota bacterium]
MSKETKSPEAEPVVCVCGNEARTYGPVNSQGKRPFLNVKVFAHHGAAKFYAQEFEGKD